VYRRKNMKKKINLKKFLFYILFVSVGYGVGYYYSPQKETVVTEKVYNDQTNKDDFSPEALLAYMKKLKIKYPETVLSQARLETGNFQSEIFKENHNLFGMKVAASRPTSAVGTNRGHAQYRNWKESVIDYALLQSYIIAKLPSNNDKEYRSYIQKFYSTTSDYLKRIDKTINSGELLSSIDPNKNTIETGTEIASNSSFSFFNSFRALYALPNLLGGNNVHQNLLGLR
jgi:hypothetical protein